MASCNDKGAYVGRAVVLEYAFGSPDVLPKESEWKRFSSLRTKEFNAPWETIDSTTDDTKGYVRSNNVTYQSLTISGDGLATSVGTLTDLNSFYFNPPCGQPKLWLRMTFPDITYVAYMILSNLSRSATYDDNVSFSMEAMATASDFGILTFPTPDPTVVAPTAIDIVPASVSMLEGQKYTAKASLLPVGASQSVQWSSDKPYIAFVNPVSGEIQAISAGVAEITASAVANPSINQSITITVTEPLAELSVSPTVVSIAPLATQQLSVTATPLGASTAVTYSIDKSEVASVDGSGLVTGIAQGEAVITITSTENPSIKLTVPVSVTA